MIHLAACALALAGFAGVALVHRAVHVAYGWQQRQLAADASAAHAADDAITEYWLAQPFGGEA